MQIVKLLYCMLFIFCIWLFIPEHNILDDYSKSYVLFDAQNELLGARISQDEQWRFPALDSIPFKFELALLNFEDGRFYHHIGVDFKALIRAVYSNVKSQRIVSGASTLTMQVMRMQASGEKRTVTRKIIEILKALKFECHNSKSEILIDYATHAPFGGNVVGLEAASWRYFSKSPYNLSWAESCMLAILPNAPGLIHPGRNRDQLLQKRNALLKKLYSKGIIDKDVCHLALLEDLPQSPSPLPNIASHFLEMSKSFADDNRFVSTLDKSKQLMIRQVAHDHQIVNSQKGIDNLAAIIVNNRTRKIEAYLGNSPTDVPNGFNDMIMAPRSSGSILKPLLYAFAMDNGLISPDALALDIPISINGFKPKNYSESYYGAIAYSEVISKSLNIPSVSLLQNYGLKMFLQNLIDLGFTSLKYNADHYGLPLILGGAEVKLYDLVSVYSGMAQILESYTGNSSQYEKLNFQKLIFNEEEKKEEVYYQGFQNLLSAGVIWSTFKTMNKVERPNEEGQWEKYQSAKPIHWKTGTSFGNKDAWAVGVTPEYTVGVWVGNADGEAQTDIIGVSAAGSVLFDIFNFLDVNDRFEMPYDDLVQKNICSISGHIASENCVDVRNEFIPSACEHTPQCPFHKSVLISKHSGKRVYRNCVNLDQLLDTTLFSLPPIAAYYFKRHHPNYEPLPDFDSACSKYGSLAGNIELEYPREETTIFIPRNLTGNREKCVLKASHKNEDAILYWHMNDEYLGSTEKIHHMAVNLSAGEYKLTIQDETGQGVTESLFVISD